MNGLSLLVLLALAIGIVVAWRMGLMRGRREANADVRTPLRPAVVFAPPVASSEQPAPAANAIATLSTAATEEHARLVRSLEAENAALRKAQDAAAATHLQLDAFAEERRRLFADLAAARAETARFRSIVIDLENNALPPLLGGPNAPDDLKLIVGIGPVLERMLHQLGVETYRQIARWNERDIDEFDAKLPEFPGRIRRDTWVTQARELHQAKFGAAPPARDR